ncbi:sensor histidine kinase [Patulibacter minatonensis]|uniref:sensor histidine kinase n=1 Tax=Patulibacter minatonensis TaxID=298163 RepID=UPI0004B18F19|nr:ATP-binding protein [Patulibacter minatonensis]
MSYAALRPAGGWSASRIAVVAAALLLVALGSYAALTTHSSKVAVLPLAATLIVTLGLGVLLARWLDVPSPAVPATADDARPSGLGVLDGVSALDRDQQEDLAKRLHDGPLQDVISALQDVEELRAGEPTDLADVETSLRAAIAGMRATSADLSDDVLRDAGLSSALRRVARKIERDGGPVIEVAVAADTSSEHDALLVAAAHELLTNVRAHARAGRAVLLVDRTPQGTLRLGVQDDGVGISASDRRSAVARGALGLRAVQERTVRAGGTFRVIDVDPGTSIRLELPVAGAADERWSTPAVAPAGPSVPVA